MPGQGLNRYIVFIATIESYGRPNVNCFLFEIKDGRECPVLQGEFKIVDENSPFRLYPSLVKVIEKGAESLNKLASFKQENKAEDKESKKRPNESESPKGSWSPKRNKKGQGSKETAKEGEVKEEREDSSVNSSGDKMKETSFESGQEKGEMNFEPSSSKDETEKNVGIKSSGDGEGSSAIDSPRESNEMDVEASSGDERSETTETSGVQIAEGGTLSGVGESRMGKDNEETFDLEEKSKDASELTETRGVGEEKSCGFEEESGPMEMGVEENNVLEKQEVHMNESSTFDEEAQQRHSGDELLSGEERTQESRETGEDQNVQEQDSLMGEDQQQPNEMKAAVSDCSSEQVEEEEEKLGEKLKEKEDENNGMKSSEEKKVGEEQSDRVGIDENQQATATENVAPIEGYAKMEEQKEVETSSVDEKGKNIGTSGVQIAGGGTSLSVSELQTKEDNGETLDCERKSKESGDPLTGVGDVGEEESCGLDEETGPREMDVEGNNVLEKQEVDVNESSTFFEKAQQRHSGDKLLSDEERTHTDDKESLLLTKEGEKCFGEQVEMEKEKEGRQSKEKDDENSRMKDSEDKKMGEEQSVRVDTGEDQQEIVVETSVPIEENVEMIEEQKDDKGEPCLVDEELQEVRDDELGVKMGGGKSEVIEVKREMSIPDEEAIMEDIKSPRPAISTRNEENQVMSDLKKVEGEKMITDERELGGIKEMSTILARSEESEEVNRGQKVGEEEKMLVGEELQGVKKRSLETLDNEGSSIYQDEETRPETKCSGDESLLSNSMPEGEPEKVNDVLVERNNNNEGVVEKRESNVDVLRLKVESADTMDEDQKAVLNEGIGKVKNGRSIFVRYEEKGEDEEEGGGRERGGEEKQKEVEDEEDAKEERGGGGQDKDPKSAEHSYSKNVQPKPPATPTSINVAEASTTVDYTKEEKNKLDAMAKPSTETIQPKEKEDSRITEEPEEQKEDIERKVGEISRGEETGGNIRPIQTGNVGEETVVSNEQDDDKKKSGKTEKIGKMSGFCCWKKRNKTNRSEREIENEQVEENQKLIEGGKGRKIKKKKPRKGNKVQQFDEEVEEKAKDENEDFDEAKKEDEVGKGKPKEGEEAHQRERVEEEPKHKEKSKTRCVLM